MKLHESNYRNHFDYSAAVNHHELQHFINYVNSCVIYPESSMIKHKIAESLLLSEQQLQVMESNINLFRLRIFWQ